MSDPVSYFQFLFRGGFMMYPLLLSGFIALVVVIERVWLLKKKLLTPTVDVRKFLQELRVASVTPSVKLTENSPVFSVIQAGLRDPSAPLDEIELSMQNEAEMWVPILEKRLEVLDTIITAAPLMGLLGTITGMMSSFQVLSSKGVNEPNAITGGVAEALIATATGLVIALITLIAFNYLNQVVKNMIFEMESASSQVIEARKFKMRTKT